MFKTLKNLIGLKSLYKCINRGDNEDWWEEYELYRPGVSILALTLQC